MTETTLWAVVVVLVVDELGRATSNGYRARIYPRDTGIWRIPNAALRAGEGEENLFQGPGQG